MLTADEVLTFWLGPEASRDEPGEATRKQWWKKDPDFDREIAETFGSAIELAGVGDLDGWAETPQGRLAIVILLDQFTRNVFRDQPKMYQHDRKAVSHALSGIDGGEAPALRLSERYFLYMPLMHAEDLELQDRCVELFRELSGQAEWCSGALGYAEAHRDIVAEFGRFPHRNRLLDRTSTGAEIRFLKQPGSSF